MPPIPPPRRLRNSAELWWLGQLRSDSETPLALLQTESAGGRHQRSVYELFAEMEEKDGHLFAALQTRRNALTGAARSVLPAGDTPEARGAASLASGLLDAIPDLDGMLRALLDALAKGFAVVELLWEYDAEGRLGVARWVPHRQEFFAFDEDGGLLLLSPPFEPARDSEEAPGAALAGRAAAPAERAAPPPERQFIVLRHGADARNRHGCGLCQRAYWYYWFKKNNLKFWAIYNEKFGAPTAVATFPPGTPEDERRRLLEVLRALQTDSGAVIPESVQLRFLEAQRNGAAGFREFADWCNDEMSKIVLGATLTSGEGRRSGSLALGEVHEGVRREYLRSDARSLETLLNGTLLRWLVELNLPGAPPPRIAFDTEPPADLARQIEVDRQLVALGVPLPLGYFHQRYGRPAPRGTEEALRYDDANLFGYHLSFGVLTVNEARARLGLKPVPWGDVPTAQSRTAQTTPDTMPNPDPPDLGVGGGDQQISRREAETPDETQSERRAEAEPRGL